MTRGGLSVAEAVAAELRVIMARKNIKPLQLVRVTGLPKSTLYDRLNGVGVIDVEQLAAICTALDADPGAIMWAAMAAAAAGRLPSGLPQQPLPHSGEHSVQR